MTEDGSEFKDELAAWSGATASLRDVVKWVAASFGALGALLIGTAPLSGVGDLTLGWSILGPLVFGTLALLAVGWVVWYTTSLLTPNTVSLSDIARHEDYADFRTQVAVEPLAYLGTLGEDVATFFVNRDTENRALAELDAKLASGALPNTPKVEASRAKLVARVNALGKVSTRLLASAGFYQLSRRFTAVKPMLFGAAGLVVVGIVGFLVTVGAGTSGTDSRPTTIPALVSLTPDGARTVGPLLGDACPRAFQVLVLSGGNSGPWTLAVTDDACTAGTIEVGDDAVRVLLQFDR